MTAFVPRLLPACAEMAAVSHCLLQFVRRSPVVSETDVGISKDAATEQDKLVRVRGSKLTLFDSRHRI